MFFSLLSLCFMLPSCLSGEQIDFSLYHTTSELYAQVRALSRSSDLFRLVKIPLDGDEYIQLVSISDYSHSYGHTRDKLRVLINCGEHGRELITSEIALNFLHLFISQQQPHLLDKKTKKVFSSKTKNINNNAFSAQTLEFLLRNVEFFLIPLTSPWSREQVENGQLCNRKTKNSVDLNRNWDYLWSQQGGGSLHDDTYSGEKPFSEPEARAVRDIAVKIKPHMYINVHSGSRDLFTGWDHRQELVPNSDEVLRLLRHLSHNHVNCSVGGAGIGGGYVVFGGSMDYLYDYLKVNYSFTWEVAGGQGPIGQCYRFFNPTTKNEFISTVNMWVASLASSALFLLSDKLSVIPPFLHTQQWLLDPSLLSKTSTSFSLSPVSLPSSSSSLSSSSLPSLSFSLLPLSSSLSSSSSKVFVLGGVEWDNVFTARVASDFVQTNKLPPGCSVLPSLFASLQYEMFFQSSSPLLCSQDMSRKQQAQLIEKRKVLEKELDMKVSQFQPSIVLMLHSSSSASGPTLAFESLSPAFAYLVTQPPKGFAISELSETVSVSTIDFARINYMPRDFIVHLTFSSPPSTTAVATAPSAPASISTVLASYEESGRECTFFEHNPPETLSAEKLSFSAHYQQQLNDVLAWLETLQRPTAVSAEQPAKKRIIREANISTSKEAAASFVPFSGLLCVSVLAFVLLFVFALRKGATRAKFHL